MALFRKNSDATAATSPVDDVDGDPSGKGRATKSRKEAEAERKERLRASARGENTKRGGRSEAATTRAARNENRRRVLAGDEKVLGPRDRGPERRYARDLVDSRHTVGEYFLYLAVFVLVLGIFGGAADIIGVLSQLMLLVIVFALVVDSVLIYRRVPRAVAERYPNGETQGIARYAMMRAMVTRRMRVPKPQVERGGVKP